LANNYLRKLEEKCCSFFPKFANLNLETYKSKNQEQLNFVEHIEYFSLKRSGAFSTYLIGIVPS
jgi:hypothetical protein